MIATAPARSRLPGWLLAGGIVAAGLAFSAAAGAELFRPATLGVAFLAGLVTGSHCLGMCGGFVLCYSAGRDAGPRRHVLYALAKTASYSALGALCGALGWTVAQGGRGPGVAALFAGIFLLVLGAHLAGWPALPARLRLAALDRAGTWLRHRARRATSPVLLGLANGLMLGCGPLLAMYVAAAGTGSAREGALLLAAFGLGTLPVMFASVWLVAGVAGTFQRRLARWSGAVVIVCGLLMLQRGFALTGAAHAAVAAPPPAVPGAGAPAPQIIRMAATATRWSPAHFTLQAGVPVRWIIDGRAAGACTARLRVPALGRDIELRPDAETVVEFTPAQPGEIAWACWMGMARGSFTVVARDRAAAP